MADMRSKVDFPGVGGTAGDHQGGAQFERLTFHLVVIDLTALPLDAVMMGFEPAPGEIGPQAVAQMPPGGKVQTQDAIPWLHQNEKDRQIGLAAGVGLHVGVGAAEELLGPVDGGLFGNVGELTTAMKAGARIALQGLVGHLVAEGIQHGPADDVFRGNQFDLGLLAGFFASQGLSNERVRFSERALKVGDHGMKLSTGAGAHLNWPEEKQKPLAHANQICYSLGVEILNQTHAHYASPAQRPSAQCLARL